MKKPHFYIIHIICIFINHIILTYLLQKHIILTYLLQKHIILAYLYTHIVELCKICLRYRALSETKAIMKKLQKNSRKLLSFFVAFFKLDLCILNY